MNRLGRHRRLERGIYWTPASVKAVVNIAAGRADKRFPHDTERADIRKWRNETIVKLQAKPQRVGKRRVKRGTFAADAERYLKAVKTLVSYADVERQMKFWSEVFGKRDRSSIAADEIRAQLAILHAKGPTGKGKKGLSPASVNKYRAALMGLWTTLDGKASPNPVKDAPKLREPDPEPRGVPFALLRQVLDAMPVSPNRARLEVMLWTGLPQASLKRIEPQHFNEKAATVYIPGRLKGRGTKARNLPLAAEAIEAFKGLGSAKAWGAFSDSSMHRALRRACARVLRAARKKQKATPELIAILERLRPYDIRHSYGTDLYQRTGDFRATQAALGHTSGKLTERYTLAAVDPRLLAAVHALSAGRMLPDDVAKKKNRRK